MHEIHPAQLETYTHLSTQLLQLGSDSKPDDEHQQLKQSTDAAKPGHLKPGNFLEPCYMEFTVHRIL